MSDETPAPKDLRFSMPWDASGPEQPAGPFKILVLAELMARGPVSGDSPMGERAVRVDKDTFPEVMAAFDLAPRLAVPDPEAGPGKEKLVTVPIPDLAAFTPDGIARALPRSAELLEVRRLVTELRDRRIDEKGFLDALAGATTDPELRDRVRVAIAGSSAPAPAAPSSTGPSSTEPSSSAPSSGDEGLGSLLDLVDVAGTEEAAATAPAAPPPGASPIDAFLSTVSSSGVGKPLSTRAVSEVLSGIDREIGAAVTQVLDHEEIRRLEAEWRGLDLLVRRIDFRAGIRLEILSVPREKLAEALATGIEPDDPVGAIAITREFGNSPPETDLLTAVAEAAEQVQAPVLVSVGGGFFDVQGAAEVPELDLLELFDGPSMIRWASLRKKECSRWVAVAFNRILLRMPYLEGGARVKRFAYEEPSAARCLGSPVWGLASLLAKSVAETGFAGGLADPRAGGTLSDLPVWEAPGGGPAIPLETVIEDDRRGDLARAGIIALVCRPGGDEAVVVGAPVAHQPERFSVPEETEAARIRCTLPYQVFVSRVAAALTAAGGRLEAGAAGDDVALAFRSALEGLLGGQAEVAVRGREITVTPSRAIAGGRAPLTFGV